MTDTTAGTIRVDHLTFAYHREPALRDVDFTLTQDAVGLLGPNGSGKTTLLRALLGQIDIKPGQVHVGALDMARQAPAGRKRLGWMPERGGIIPGHSGVGLVAYMGELSGMPRTGCHAAGARGAALRRPARRALPPLRHLQPGHAPAPQAGLRPGARPRVAAARRAHQRPRSRRSRGHAGAGERPRRPQGPGRDPVDPSAGRRRGHLQRDPGPRAGPAPGAARRGARRRRRPAGLRDLRLRRRGGASSRPCRAWPRPSSATAATSPRSSTSTPCRPATVPPPAGPSGRCSNWPRPTNTPRAACGADRSPWPKNSTAWSTRRTPDAGP